MRTWNYISSSALRPAFLRKIQYIYWKPLKRIPHTRDTQGIRFVVARAMVIIGSFVSLHGRYRAFWRALTEGEPRGGAVRVSSGESPNLRFADGQTWTFARRAVPATGRAVTQITAVNTTDLDAARHARATELYLAVSETATPAQTAAAVSALPAGLLMIGTSDDLFDPRGRAARKHLEGRAYAFAHTPALRLSAG
ncbi:MAG: hypothetical protein LBH86_01400, partial [Oscillospiraceae bacterium]|nr:hypothetical protein [Oscillospiraceae bacterium]